MRPSQSRVAFTEAWDPTAHGCSGCGLLSAVSRLIRTGDIAGSALPCSQAGGRSQRGRCWPSGGHKRHPQRTPAFLLGVSTAAC
ncbi:unnamed protein product, partial [Gulo gulo]